MISQRRWIWVASKRGQDLRARSPRAAPCLPGIGGTVTTRCMWSFINIQFFYLNVLALADYPDTFFDVLRYGSLPEFESGTWDTI